MSLSIYNLSLYLYYFAIRCYSTFNKKAELWLNGRAETKQLIQTKALKPFKGALLFHAASLGEFEQARPLIEKIRALHPHQKIVVSFFSPSGYEVRKKYELADKVLYLPYDFPANIEPFLQQLAPKAIIIVRYEFWINTIKAAKRLHIPIYLIAASFRKDQIFFQAYGTLFKKLLKTYKKIFVTKNSHIELLKSIDITEVSLAPDTRIDRVIDIAAQQKELAMIQLFLENKTCCIVAGSTWNKDLDILIPYLIQHPDRKYIIAPHHIDEGTLQAIESKLTIPNIRYSKLSNNFVLGTNVLIIDNFGMLSSLYKFGKYAYIGGGFGTSVHNVLEATVYGKPVFFGPHFKKANECIDLIEQEAAFSIIDAAAFSNKINALESSEILYQKASEQALKYIESNKGGTEIIYQNILPLLA